MKIKNRSYLAPRILKPILRFVLARVRKEADLVTLTQAHQVDLAGRPTCGGLATRDGDSYSVEVGVDDRCEYPRVQRLCYRTPVELRSVEEEVVVILAHEMRHLDQFAGRTHEGRDLEAEVDAELFAAEVLEQWRQKHVDAGGGLL